MPLNLIASFRIKFIKFSRKKATSEIVVGGMISIGLFFYFIHPADTTNTLALHIGKPYEAVVRDSTFPIKSKTLLRPTEPPVADSTWINSPVIVKFDDPQHGFILPATLFGAVGYNKERVTTITTSPMLETVTFEQLIPRLKHLQDTLQKAGWVPKNKTDNTWIKIENKNDRALLQNTLFEKVVVATLLIPEKYRLDLNVKCYKRCDERNPQTAKYLIDVSIGTDFSNL
ncbi:hypothetical protein ACW9H6_16840 [Pseudomonas sp. SDO528_S397]